MGKQDPPQGARPLDETYERIRRHGETHGKDAEQAKRDAAEAVHEERRQEGAADRQRGPDKDHAPR
jgi:hypothetical protein